MTLLKTVLFDMYGLIITLFSFNTEIQNLDSHIVHWINNQFIRFM